MEPKTSKNPESVVREIKRKTRRKFNSEEKIRIILEGLKGEDSIAAILRSIAPQGGNGGNRLRIPAFADQAIPPIYPDINLS